MDHDPLALGAHFEAADADAWRSAAQKAAGGRAPETLARTTLEGIRVPILYTAPVEGALNRALAPLAGPEARRTSGWDVRALCDAGSVDEAALALAAALGQGARSLWIVLGDGLYAPDGASLQRLLSTVDLAATPVALDAGAEAPAYLGALAALIRQRGLSTTALSGEVPWDPLAVLARSGCLEAGLEGAWALGAAMLGWAAEHAPSLRVIGLDARPYDDAGAHAAQSLGYLLATAAETLRGLEARGITPTEAAPYLTARVAVGADLFTGVASLRALRLTMARLLEACGVAEACRGIFVHAVSTGVELSRRDPWTNLLRGTAAGFAAAVGGADAITLLPHDHALGQPDAAAQRLATTTQAVLALESHLARVHDPAAGAFHVEHLTTAIAHDAWSRMQAIEAAGGMARHLTSGRVAQEVAATVQTRRALLARRRHTAVGVNDFVHLDAPSITRPPRAAAPPSGGGGMHIDAEDPIEGAAAVCDFGPPIAGLTHSLALGLVATVAPLGAPPLRPFRAADDWEALRDAAASAGDPAVVLVRLGPPAGHRARVEWIGRVVDAWGLRTAPEDAEPRAAILCGRDEDYTAAADRVAALRAAGVTWVAVAGRAGPDADALRAAGIDAFVHLDADLLALGHALLAAQGRREDA